MKGNTGKSNQDTINTESLRANNGSPTIREIDDTTGNVISAVSNTCEGDYIGQIGEHLKHIKSLVSINEDDHELISRAKEYITLMLEFSLEHYKNYLSSINDDSNSDEITLSHIDALLSKIDETINTTYYAFKYAGEDKTPEEQQSLEDQLKGTIESLNQLKEYLSGIINTLEKGNNQEEEK